MWSLMPILVILIAIVAAASIAYIAWELTSDDIQDSIDFRKRQNNAVPPDENEQ